MKMHTKKAATTITVHLFEAITVDLSLAVVVNLSTAVTVYLSTVFFLCRRILEATFHTHRLPREVRENRALAQLGTVLLGRVHI